MGGEPLPGQYRAVLFPAVASSIRSPASNESSRARRLARPRLSAGVSPVPSDVAAAKKRAQSAQSVEFVQDGQHRQNGKVAWAADGELGEQGSVGLEQLGQGDRHKLLVVLER